MSHGPRRPTLARKTPHTEHDVTVHGMRIRYVDVGERDAPTLLLIHGHTSRIEEYDDLVPHLARGHRVIVPDLPGSGYSDKPTDRPYTLRFYEDTLLGLLDTLKVREAHIGGGSLGGNLTLRLGHREAERFPRLAAWAPAGAWKPLKAVSEVGKALGRAAGRALFWPFVWVQSRFWYEASWPHRDRTLKETFAYYREVMGPGFARMYFELGFDQMAHSHFPYANAIKQPTLLAWGDRDHALGMGEGVKALSKLIPRAELTVFKGAKHSLANEVPAELGALVSGFLRRPA